MNKNNEIQKIFSKNLKRLLEEKNTTQLELAKYLNVSNTTINNYVKGYNMPRMDKIDGICEFFNVKRSDLIEDNGSSSSRTILDLTQYKNILPFKKSTKKVPLVGTIAAGPPILAEQNIEEYIDIDKKVDADFCLRVSGDSMINANIKNGDIVFIKKQSDVDDGEIAAVLIDGEATLKRVFKIGDVVQLRAENPIYSPILLNGETPALILGKATYKLSKVL